MTDNDFQPYGLPDADNHPATIVARLIEDEEHKHIKECEIKIDYLMARSAKRKGGKQIIGAVHLPTVQGRLKDLFEQLLSGFFGEMPQFLMIIDEAWWNEADETSREALVWHELSHIKQETDAFGDLRFDQDGNPKFGLVEHDVSAFHSEVARYGAWEPELQRFVQSIKQF